MAKNEDKYQDISFVSQHIHFQDFSFSRTHLHVLHNDNFSRACSRAQKDHHFSSVRPFAPACLPGCLNFSRVHSSALQDVNYSTSCSRASTNLSVECVCMRSNTCQLLQSMFMCTPRCQLLESVFTFTALTKRAWHTCSLTYTPPRN